MQTLPPSSRPITPPQIATPYPPTTLSPCSQPSAPRRRHFDTSLPPPQIVPYIHTNNVSIQTHNTPWQESIQRVMAQQTWEERIQYLMAPVYCEWNVPRQFSRTPIPNSHEDRKARRFNEQMKRSRRGNEGILYASNSHKISRGSVDSASDKSITYSRQRDSSIDMESSSKSPDRRKSASPLRPRGTKKRKIDWASSNISDDLQALRSSNLELNSDYVIQTHDHTDLGSKLLTSSPVDDRSGNNEGVRSRGALDTKCSPITSNYQQAVDNSQTSNIPRVYLYTTDCDHNPTILGPGSNARAEPSKSFLDNTVLEFAGKDASETSDLEPISMHIETSLNVDDIAMQTHSAYIRAGNKQLLWEHANVPSSSTWRSLQTLSPSMRKVNSRYQDSSPNTEVTDEVANSLPSISSDDVEHVLDKPEISNSEAIVLSDLMRPCEVKQDLENGLRIDSESPKPDHEDTSVKSDKEVRTIVYESRAMRMGEPLFIRTHGISPILRSGDNQNLSAVTSPRQKQSRLTKPSIDTQGLMEAIAQTYVDIESANRKSQKKSTTNGKSTDSPRTKTSPNKSSANGKASPLRASPIVSSSQKAKPKDKAIGKSAKKKSGEGKIGGKAKVQSLKRTRSTDDVLMSNFADLKVDIASLDPDLLKKSHKKGASRLYKLAVAAHQGIRSEEPIILDPIKKFRTSTSPKPEASP